MEDFSHPLNNLPIDSSDISSKLETPLSEWGERIHSPTLQRNNFERVENFESCFFRKFEDYFWNKDADSTTIGNCKYHAFGFPRNTFILSRHSQY